MEMYFSTSIRKRRRFHHMSPLIVCAIKRGRKIHSISFTEPVSHLRLAFDGDEQNGCFEIVEAVLVITAYFLGRGI